MEIHEIDRLFDLMESIDESARATAAGVLFIRNLILLIIVFNLIAGTFAFLYGVGQFL